MEAGIEVMDARERLVRETMDWIALLTTPVEDRRLREKLHSEVVRRVFQSEPIPMDSPQVIEYVETATLPSLTSHNLSLIKSTLKSRCSQELRSFSSPSILQGITRTYPSNCFYLISTFATIITNHFNEVTQKYLTETSHFQVKLPDFLIKCESKLIKIYETLNIEDFSLLKLCFESNFQLPDLENLSVLPLFQLINRLNSLFTESLSQLECLNELLNGLLPVSIRFYYENEVKTRFLTFTETILDQISVKYFDYMKNLGRILREKQDLILFDSRILSIKTQKMIKTGLFLSIGSQNNSEKTEIARKIVNKMPGNEWEMENFEEFGEKIREVQLELTYEMVGFIGICTLLAVMEGEKWTYRPIDRVFYRDFLWVLFNHSSIFLSNIDWLIGKIAEMAVASIIKPDPLLGHIPALILEEALSGERQEEVVVEESRVGRLVQSLVSLLHEVQGDQTHQTCHWESLKSTDSLNITIVISGWHSEESDYKKDWKAVIDYPMQGTVLGYRWEAGTAFGFASLSALSALPGLAVGYLPALWSGVSGSLQAFKAADRRAKQAGCILAQALLMRACGMGPVTLVGFSLGTAVIYHCLQELAKTPYHQLILDVILLGGAVSSHPSTWEALKPTFQGRIINIYSEHDWALRLYSLVTHTPPIGLRPLEVSGVQNIDVSDRVRSHQDHRKYMKELMERVGYRP